MDLAGHAGVLQPFLHLMLDTNYEGSVSSVSSSKVREYAKLFRVVAGRLRSVRGCSYSERSVS